MLGTISTQLNRMEGKSFTNQYKPEKEEKEPKQENPLFKPAKPLKLGGNRNDGLIKIFTQKLTSIEIKDPSSSKNQVNFLNGSETSSTISKNPIEILHNSEEEEQEQINKLKTWHQISKKFYQ